MATESGDSFSEDNCCIWEDELSNSDEDASEWETVLSEDEQYQDYDDYRLEDDHSGHYQPYACGEDRHLGTFGSDWQQPYLEQVEVEHPFEGYPGADTEADADREPQVDMLHFSEEGVRLLMSPSIGHGTDECGSGFVIQAWLVSDGSPTDAVRVVTGMVCGYSRCITVL